MSNRTLSNFELILKNPKNKLICAEYLKNWLCDTGLLVSRGSRCCICCFCLPPVGRSVSLAKGFLGWELLSTSKLSFLLGFWSSYLYRCVPAGGQVSVRWEHPWRHPHRDSRSAGVHKSYWSCFKRELFQFYQRQLLRHGAMLTGWPFGRLGWGRAFCQRQHHSRRRGRNIGAFCLDFPFDNFSVGPDWATHNHSDIL